MLIVNSPSNLLLCSYITLGTVPIKLTFVMLIQHERTSMWFSLEHKLQFHFRQLKRLLNSFFNDIKIQTTKQDKATIKPVCHLGQLSRKRQSSSIYIITQPRGRSSNKHIDLSWSISTMKWRWKTPCFQQSVIIHDPDGPLTVWTNTAHHDLFHCGRLADAQMCNQSKFSVA